MECARLYQLRFCRFKAHVKETESAVFHVEEKAGEADVMLRVERKKMLGVEFPLNSYACLPGRGPVEYLGVSKRCTGL